MNPCGHTEGCTILDMFSNSAYWYFKRWKWYCKITVDIIAEAEGLFFEWRSWLMTGRQDFPCKLQEMGFFANKRQACSAHVNTLVIGSNKNVFSHFSCRAPKHFPSVKWPITWHAVNESEWNIWFLYYVYSSCNCFSLIALLKFELSIENTLKEIWFSPIKNLSKMDFFYTVILLRNIMVFSLKNGIKFSQS